ncbi:MAG: hypothetical protein N2V73_06740 [Candidatus Methanospirare jalkutatii]|nr:hypothetical protein [Candidatus Methanospirare jalkutatii]
MLVVMLAFALHNYYILASFCVAICVRVREERARKATSKYKVRGKIRRYGKERGRAGA